MLGRRRFARAKMATQGWGTRPCHASSSLFSAWRSACIKVGAYARLNQYDKVTEYWVTVRERGSREQLHETEQRTTSKSKALAKIMFQKVLHT